MLNIKEKVIYRAFGYNVSSEIPLPELLLSSKHENFVDIEIKIEDLSGLWQQLAAPHVNFVMRDNFFMFQVSELATFLVKDGRSVLVSPMENGKEDKLRLFILGTAMGALLIQRKVFPLHGSAIAVDGKAYAIIGESGAGKSTLASTFLDGGYQILSDDVIAVSLSENNHPMVTPSYPQQKLWQESLNQLGLEIHRFQPLFERETKFAVPVREQFIQEPLPLAGIFEIVKTEGEHIQLLPVQGLKQLHTLYNHTYRNFIISYPGLMDWHFNMSVSIINQVDMFQLRRPNNGFTAFSLASLILTTIWRNHR